MIKIGIDPDVKKSGFCILLGNQVTELTTLSFFDLAAHLLELKEYYDGCLQKYVVVIEKGQNNKALFNAKGSKNTAQKIAMNTGKNFAITDLLIEYCKRNDIVYKTYTPRTPKWEESYCRKVLKNLPIQLGEEKRDAIRAAIMG